MTAFYYFCGHEQWQPEVLVEHAVAAEAAGFDGLLVSDHYQPWVDDAGASGYAFSTLGAIARATHRVRLATGVVTPLFRHHPGVIAQAAATIDRLSGGRFDLGLGTGERINEGPLGLPFPPYAERARRMREALPIIRRLLDGEKVTFNGQYYQTDRARLYSPPLGRVAIWMGAAGPRSATLGGCLADGIVTSVKDPAESLERVILPARRAAADNGCPPPTLVTTRWVVAARNDDEAWQALLPWRGLRAPGRLEAVDPADLRRRADEMPRSEVLQRFTVAGDVAALVAAYRPLIEVAGADVVTLQVASLRQMDTIALLGAEVLPRLRAVPRPADPAALAG